MVAEAEMRAAAESEMAVGMARHIEISRPLELRRIAVRRAVKQAEFGPAREKSGVFGSVAMKERQRRFETERRRTAGKNFPAARKTT